MIRCSQVNPDGVARAGFGSGPDAGNRLFDAIVDSPSGVVFTDDTWEATWQRIKTADGLVHVEIPELLVELAELADETPPGDDPHWPLLLSAGERRSFTANTILRDPAWRKKDLDGALRVSPADAERIGVADGGAAKLSTKRSSAVVTVAVDDDHPTRPRLAAQRVRPGPCRGGRAGEDRRGDQRVHGQRGPRPVGRHAVAQDHTGPTRAGVTPRRVAIAHRRPMSDVMSSVAVHVIASSPRPCPWRGRIRRRRWPRSSMRTERPCRERDE